MARFHLPVAPDKWNKDWGNQLVRELEKFPVSPYSKQPWALTTADASYTLTSGVSSLSLTQDVLGTLIKALQKKGIL